MQPCVLEKAWGRDVCNHFELHRSEHRDGESELLSGRLFGMTRRCVSDDCGLPCMSTREALSGCKSAHLAE